MAVAEKKEAPRKRPPEPLENGLCVGSEVFARCSGIKFAHGVIAKTLTSSKWVLVTFTDTDTESWVTSRDLVKDAVPPPSACVEGAEIIAGWADDGHYYKGVIIGVTPSGRCRIRFDDWDEGTVPPDLVRLLPQNFGKKRPKKEEPAKDASKAAVAAAVAPVKDEGGGGGADDAKAAAAAAAAEGDAKGAAKEGADEALAASSSPAAAATSTTATATAASEGDVGTRMAAFVQRAREQLQRTDPHKFEQLTRLLAQGGAGATPSLDADLTALLGGFPRLLDDLRALIGAPVDASGGGADDGGGGGTGAGEGGAGAPSAEDDKVAPHKGGARASAKEGGGNGGGGGGSGGGGRGARELSKLLGDFGHGGTVGVEIGSKTRQRGATAVETK